MKRTLASLAAGATTTPRPQVLGAAHFGSRELARVLDAMIDAQVRAKRERLDADLRAAGFEVGAFNGVRIIESAPPGFVDIGRLLK